MTIEKSDEEILSSRYDELTDEEFEYQHYLIELLQLGYYEPYQITLVDIVDVMRRNNVISEEDADRFHYTKEDEDRLNKVLMDDWDRLDECDRAICHALNRTLPRWGKPRPPTEEHIQGVKEIINKKPSLK